MPTFTVQEWPPSYRRWWPDREEGPWQLTLPWAEVDGGLQCVGMAIDPIPGREVPFTPFTPADVRQVALSRLTEEYRLERFEANQQQLMDVESAREAGVIPESVAEELEAAARYEDDRLAGSPRFKGGRPAEYGEEHYRQVADVYKQAARLGVSGLTRAVADHFHVSRPTANRWITRARELGFLPSSRGTLG